MARSPSLSAALASAPASSSTLTKSQWPFTAATWSGSLPSMLWLICTHRTTADSRPYTYTTILRPLYGTWYIIYYTCSTLYIQTHTQPFNGLLSGTTRVGRYQKKHSPTHTHPDHRTSFITFLHLQRSMASSLFSLRAWQSSRTTSLQVLFGLPLGPGPSTSYSMHFFTQSSSSFRSTCPYIIHYMGKTDWVLCKFSHGSLIRQGRLAQLL